MNQPTPSDETEYLLSSEANAARLMESIGQLKESRKGKKSGRIPVNEIVNGQRPLLRQRRPVV